MSDYERFALPADHYDDPVARGEAEPEPLATRYLRLHIAVRAAVAELDRSGWIADDSPVAARLRKVLDAQDPAGGADRLPSDG